MMPVPNPEVKKAGIWSPYDLPSEPQYKTLSHLNEAGEPRLQLVVKIPMKGRLIDPHDLRKLRSSHHGRLSNSAHKAGWVTQIDLDRVLENRWIERRKEEEKQLPEYKRNMGVTLWALSEKGREAIAQYRARKEIKKQLTVFLKSILDEARREAKLNVPPPA